MFGVRTTLRYGAIIFGLSAILLLIAPATFIELLAMNPSRELEWSTEMIGITLVALAGNMWVNSTNPENPQVRQIGFVMAVAASSLGILRLLIPAEINWFASAYAVIRFAFGLNYLLCLLRKNY